MHAHAPVSCPTSSVLPLVSSFGVIMVPSLDPCHILDPCSGLRDPCSGLWDPCFGLLNPYLGLKTHWTFDSILGLLDSSFAPIAMLHPCLPAYFKLPHLLSFYLRILQHRVPSIQCTHELLLLCLFSFLRLDTHAPWNDCLHQHALLCEVASLAATGHMAEASSSKSGSEHVQARMPVFANSLIHAAAPPLPTLPAVFWPGFCACFPYVAYNSWNPALRANCLLPPPHLLAHNLNSSCQRGAPYASDGGHKVIKVGEAAVTCVHTCAGMHACTRNQGPCSLFDFVPCPGHRSNHPTTTLSVPQGSCSQASRSLSWTHTAMITPHTPGNSNPVRRHMRTHTHTHNLRPTHSPQNTTWCTNSPMTRMMSLLAPLSSCSTHCLMVWVCGRHKVRAGFMMGF